MIGQRFDDFARSLVLLASRRNLIGAVLGLVVAPGAAPDSRVHARRRCRSLGAVCSSSRRQRCCRGTRCVEGRCRCPNSKRRCRGRCIRRGECCTNKQCPGKQVCRKGTCCRPKTVVETCARPGRCGPFADGCGGTVRCGGCPACEKCVNGVCKPAPNRTRCADNGVCCNGVCCDGCCGDDGTCGACLVFLTSQVFGGDLGGAFGAHTKCQQAADAAELPGSYAAWISDETIVSAPMFRFRRSKQPYVLPDASVVADDWDDLVSDNDLKHQINVTEHNLSVPPAQFVHTYTSPSGTRLDGANECCNGWTSNSDDFSSTVGLHAAQDAGWTHSTTQPCSTQNRLYCFQQD